MCKVCLSLLNQDLPEQAAQTSNTFLQLEVLSQPRRKQPQRMLPCRQQNRIYQSSRSKLLPDSPQD
ncbi:hypothetical protein MtrunA17_Chr3g0115491 [Medicago truncatula]|uniref:Uncharacterized protein n=1 Tax=Medicago truncatula TaxID=3880 RepID=A0A396IS58_MEDTR|nr:hypothetical protein MtrunA17_Chr3g0115491 [Medicago truncatula]